MAQTIGIVAVSPEGSSFCYRTIGRRAAEIADPEQRPSVTLHNLPFSTYVEALAAGDWNTVGEMLTRSNQVLSNAGADFCVLPDNVAHHALPLAEPVSPLPWLNMIDLVASEIEYHGCGRVGLIGTKYVTYGSTYQTVLGLRRIHLHVPDEEDAETIDRIIFSEAIFGRVRRESMQVVQRAVERLGKRGAEAVILGCSEASLLMALEDSPLPVFDPVELLAEAAVERAVAPADSQPTA